MSPSCVMSEINHLKTLLVNVIVAINRLAGINVSGYASRDSPCIKQQVRYKCAHKLFLMLCVSCYRCATQRYIIYD